MAPLKKKLTNKTVDEKCKALKELEKGMSNKRMVKLSISTLGDVFFCFKLEILRTGCIPGIHLLHATP